MVPADKAALLATRALCLTVTEAIDKAALSEDQDSIAELTDTKLCLSRNMAASALYSTHSGGRDRLGRPRLHRLRCHWGDETGAIA